MGELAITIPAGHQHAGYAALGLGALGANKLRYAVTGYRKPRPFGNDRSEAVIDHAFATVDKMRSWLPNERVEGHRILELGPGDNLCVGLLFLALGARSYTAADLNDLVRTAPAGLYERLFHRMQRHGLDVIGPRRALELVNRGPLRSRVLPDFDLRALCGNEFDVVVSQAAFEHFTHPTRTIGELSELVTDDARLGVEIDLMTHTGALRFVDPLNIYRFPNALYRALRFAGIPNRRRPQTYVDALSAAGWADIRTRAAETLPEAYVAAIRPRLSAPFREPEAAMHELVTVITAGRRFTAPAQPAVAAAA